MPPGRPPLEPMPNWPALLTAELAARYLSVDENSLRVLAQAHGVGPVDLKVELERWRRTDLDRLVRGLPTKPIVPSLRDPPTGRISDADLDRIAARIQGAKPAPQRRVYSFKEAAEVCGLSRTTLWRMARRGELKTIRIGSRTLVAAEQIDALLSAAER